MKGCQEMGGTAVAFDGRVFLYGSGVGEYGQPSPFYLLARSLNNEDGVRPTPLSNGALIPGNTARQFPHVTITIIPRPIYPLLP